MSTIRRFGMSCWSEPASLVALGRNPARYQIAAQAVLDAVPDSWNGIRAWMKIDDRNWETCGARATCGAQEEADDACLDAVRDALVILARGALIPQGLSWVRVCIDFHLEKGRLKASLTTGEPIRRSMDMRIMAATMKAIAETMPTAGPVETAPSQWNDGPRRMTGS